MSPLSEERIKVLKGRGIFATGIAHRSTFDHPFLLFNFDF